MSTLDTSPEAKERMVKKCDEEIRRLTIHGVEVQDRANRILERLAEDIKVQEETKRFWLGE